MKLTGTIVFTPAKDLKVGDLVISLKSIYKIVDKVANPNEYSLRFASDLESLKQIQIEYEVSILKQLGNFGSPEHQDKNATKLPFVDLIKKSLPLSFSQYALALEIGEGAKCEFEIRNYCKDGGYAESCEAYCDAKGCIISTAKIILPEPKESLHDYSSQESALKLPKEELRKQRDANVMHCIEMENKFREMDETESWDEFKTFIRTTSNIEAIIEYMQENFMIKRKKQ